MTRVAIACLLLVADAARADPAAVEWTAWVGVGGGIAHEPDDRSYVIDLRLGAAVDFELAQYSNPGRWGGGKLELRWGFWMGAETRSDTSYLHAGLALDLGQTRHAQFGTYTIRAGGGIDIDGRPIASLTGLGGVRYVERRTEHHPKTAFASGGRGFGMVMTDFDGRSSILIGIEFEPTWVLPPYSLRKLAGASSGF